MTRRLALPIIATIASATVILALPGSGQAHHLEPSGSATCIPGTTDWTASYTFFHPGPADWGTYYGTFTSGPYVGSSVTIAPGGSTSGSSTSSGDGVSYTITGFFDRNGNGVDDGDSDPNHTVWKNLTRPPSCPSSTTTTTEASTTSTTSTTTSTSTSTTSTTTTVPGSTTTTSTVVDTTSTIPDTSTTQPGSTSSTSSTTTSSSPTTTSTPSSTTSTTPPGTTTEPERCVPLADATPADRNICGALVETR